MISMLLAVTAAWLLQDPTSPPSPASDQSPPPLQREVDNAEMSRCMGGLYGFRNVPVQCVSDDQGVLRQCRLLTSNRAARRQADKFACMAAATRVRLPDGSPAVGRTVRLTLHGTSEFSGGRD